MISQHANHVALPELALDSLHNDSPQQRKFEELVKRINSSDRSCDSPSKRRNSEGSVQVSDKITFLLQQYVTSADHLQTVLERADKRVSLETPREEPKQRSILPFPVTFLRCPRNQAFAIIFLIVLIAAMLWQIGQADYPNRNRAHERWTYFTFA
eukprot:515768-Rhodomonas_salina.3